MERLSSDRRQRICARAHADVHLSARDVGRLDEEYLSRLRRPPFPPTVWRLPGTRCCSAPTSLASARPHLVCAGWWLAGADRHRQVFHPLGDRDLRTNAGFYWDGNLSLVCLHPSVGLGSVCGDDDHLGLESSFRPGHPMEGSKIYAEIVDGRKSLCKLKTTESMTQLRK